MCYERICRRHISPALGSMQLTKLKPAHLQALYKSKTDEGLSPATVRGIHVVLHKAMKQALRWDLVPRNPASGAKPPRPSDPEVTPLTKEQARQLLGTLSVEGDRFEVLYAVALATGLRIGELLGLRWQDVALDTDHSGGELRVRRTLGRTRPKREGYAGYAFGTPKGGTGRSVRFKAGAARLLRSHKARQVEEKLRLGADYADSDLVFTKEEGGLLPPWKVWRHFASLLRRSGLPPVRFHTLRHTAATLMLENGEHPKVVQEMLGHANISQTLDTYSHVTPNMQLGAAERLDSVLF
jgi:integrase